MSFLWNFGSLLGLFLGVQILSGLLLSVHYNSSISLAFGSVVHICMDVNWGWLVRYIHSNGATFFFIFVYLHIARSIFFMSFSYSKVWLVGVMIFLVFMGVAFLGYVLPWGQMSYWGATVITNLISAIPYLGSVVVEWVWGGFSVSEPTLMRFYSFHFLFPFLGVLLVGSHLFFLHSSGSSNPLGLSMNSDKISFHPFFSIKDVMGFVFAFFFFFIIIFKYPFTFMDPDNYIEANPLVTPAHIQPEWYFLFAYAILRSVPSKLGGVVLMLMSILFLTLLPLISKKNNISMNKTHEWLSLLQYVIFLLLSWVGSLPVEQPYYTLGQVLSLFYFFNLTMMFFFN